MEQVIMEEQDERKTLCAVSNPSTVKYRPWFINCFRGKLLKEKTNRNEIKTNFLMTLTESEIILLQSKSCNIIKISEEIEIEDDNKYKETLESVLDILKQNIEVIKKVLPNEQINKLKKIMTKNGEKKDEHKLI